MRCTGSCTGRLVGIVALTLPLAASRASAQGSFEGTVTYQMMSPNNPTQVAGNMIYMVKDNQARLEMTSNNPQMAGMGGVVSLYDPGHQKMYVLMPQMKGYMDLSSSITQTQQRTDSAMSTTQFQKTGSETVAGIPCDDYQGKDPQGKIGFVCVAHNMGTWLLFSGKNPMMHGMNGGPFGSLFKQGFFPLKLGSVEDGKPVTKMVATSVQRKTLDPSLFVLPADYQDMSKMGNGALGAMMQNQQMNGAGAQKPGQP